MQEVPGFVLSLRGRQHLQKARLDFSLSIYPPRVELWTQVVLPLRTAHWALIQQVQVNLSSLPRGLAQFPTTGLASGGTAHIASTRTSRQFLFLRPWHVPPLCSISASPASSHTCLRPDTAAGLPCRPPPRSVPRTSSLSKHQPGQSHVLKASQGLSP